MAAPSYERHGVTVYAGDCLDRLRELTDESVDAVVCDPPYGLAEHKPAALITALTAWANGDREHVPDGKGFMGRDWDAFVPPPAVWDECLRVLKPGGHLLAFAGSRTADLMGLSVRMAGFEIRDTIMWVYGSGMPKGIDVSKAIDKMAPREGMLAAFAAHYGERRRALGLTHREICEAGKFYAEHNKGGASVNWEKGYNVPTREQWAVLSPLLNMPHEMWEPLIARAEAEREVVGVRTASRFRFAPDQGSGIGAVDLDLTVAATPAAARWEGWNTALRPSQEPIIVARKPLAGTVAATVLAHGTAALNIDACRVGDERRTNHAGGSSSLQRVSRVEQGYRDHVTTSVGVASTVTGRWPSNVVLTHAPDCVDGGTCVAGCPVAELDQQSGHLTSGTLAAHHARAPKAAGILGAYGSAAGERGYGDQGGASRFFPVFRWEAKAPTSERPQVAALPLLRLREDLSADERAHVLAELTRAGVDVA